jgi:hypothetical protein
MVRKLFLCESAVMMIVRCDGEDDDVESFVSGFHLLDPIKPPGHFRDSWSHANHQDPYPCIALDSKSGTNFSCHTPRVGVRF